jgi:hypothetical protein
LLTVHYATTAQYNAWNNPICGRTINFANSPPRAFLGSTGQKSSYGLMTLTYQPFTAVLLSIYGSLFLSGICYCLCMFWCTAVRMSELELEQRTNITHILVFKIPKTSADQK